MDHRVTRRGLLQAGASIGVAGFAGCEQRPSNVRTDGAGATDQTQTVGENGHALTADFVVWNDGERVGLTNGRTLEAEAIGEAGVEDADVIQAALDRLVDRERGGRVFIKYGAYELHRSIEIRTDRTELVSNQARLRFHDHDHTDAEGVQLDLTIHSHDDVRLSGLAIDGNKDRRTSPTRTINLSNSDRFTVERCDLRGGRGTRPGGGYAIGGPNDGTDTVIHNCIIRDSDRHGLHPNKRASELRVTNCTFRNNGWGSDGSAAAIQGHSGPNVLVANNLFLDNASGYHSGGERLDRVSVTDNVFVDNGGNHDGQVKISETTGRVFIRGNVFAFTDDELVEVGRHVSISIHNRAGGSISVAGNRFLDGADQIASQLGDEAARLDKLVVHNNEFEGSRGPIVHAEGVQLDIVRGNIIDPEHDGELFSGHASVDRGLIVDNVLLGGATGEVEDAGGVVVDGNRRL